MNWERRHDAMKHRLLGKDLKVSAIGLGCMGFSHAYGAPMPQKEAIKAIREAYEMGYTFFDTAEIYGTEQNPNENELLVGEALKPYRNHVKIATKFGIGFDKTDERINHSLLPNAQPDVIRKSVEDSLKRLKTDYIDLYFQHRIDPNTSSETVAQVMKELIKEGKILHWGISEANETYLRQADAVCKVTAIENRYSMMARSCETLFPVLEELNIGFVAFSPIANGFLSGKYHEDSVFDKKYDYRSIMPQFATEAQEKNKELLMLLHDMAEEKHATEAQISLAWMIYKKPYIVPIPGTRKTERMKENLSSAEVFLSKKEVRALDEALEKISMSEVFEGSNVKR